MTEQEQLPHSPSLPVPPIAELGRIWWSEVPIYADLIAAFYEREGRDPIGIEYSFIVLVARLMTLAGARTLH